MRSTVLDPLLTPPMPAALVPWCRDGDGRLAIATGHCQVIAIDMDWKLRTGRSLLLPQRER